MSDKLLIVRRRLPAQPSAVFAALTDPAIMARWFFAGPDWSARVESTPEAGGAYRLEMVEPDGTVNTIWGEYVELSEPKRLVFTWNSHIARDTTVTIELNEAGNGETDLTLYHALPEDAEIIKSHQMGWEGCLGSLERYLGPASTSTD